MADRQKVDIPTRLPIPVALIEAPENSGKLLEILFQFI
jgi:hypothetical protein